MSSIPNTKMKHAHARDDDHAVQGAADGAAGGKKAKKAKDGPSLSDRARDIGERAQDLAEEAVDAVKARPKTAAAIGAGLVAGAAALVGAATGAFKGDEKKPPAKKKPAKKA